MNKIHKIITYGLIGSLIYFGNTTTAKAVEEPVAGINLVLNDLYKKNGTTHEDIAVYLTSIVPQEYKDIAFAKVTNYVNIRSKAGEDGEILGKLYQNSAATILDEEDGWYKIKSGSVTGFIKAEFLITGSEAQDMAKLRGTRIAKITATALRARKSASSEAAIITLLQNGEDLVVKEEKDGWVKVLLDRNEIGYVSAEFVELRTEFEEAVSIEEERERLAAEEAANQERQSLARQRASTLNTPSGSNNTQPGNSIVLQQPAKVSKAGPTNSALRNKIVSYALKFKGNPYVWGGTSLTQGADCSGFTQSVFRDNGISISRTSRTQATGGKRIPVNEIQPGDLLFYAKNGIIDHVAIYIGNGKIIGASNPKYGIRISNYNYRQPYKAVNYID